MAGWTFFKSNNVRVGSSTAPVDEEHIRKAHAWAQQHRGYVIVLDAEKSSSFRICGDMDVERYV